MIQEKQKIINVSLPMELLEHADSLACALKIPLDAFIARALDDYVRRNEAQENAAETTEKPSAAYSEELDEEEQRYLRAMQRKTREILDEW